jgi:hypothetical protein
MAPGTLSVARNQGISRVMKPLFGAAGGRRPLDQPYDRIAANVCLHLSPILTLALVKCVPRAAHLAGTLPVWPRRA